MTPRTRVAAARLLACAALLSPLVAGAQALRVPAPPDVAF